MFRSPSFLFLLLALGSPARSSEPAGSNPQRFLYEHPASLTGSIYARNPEGHLLFKFKCTATRSGSTLNVLREYSYPDGKPAARERVVYHGNALQACDLEELQTGGAGSAKIERDPKDPARTVLVFQYAKDAATHAASSLRSEPFVGDTLVNDMVGPFLASHWDRLLRGEKVTCRYIVVPRKETVGFTFAKESESKWRGQEVIIVKMQPTSRVISALVDPVYFTIEKAPPHRVLQYVGRTTPKLGQGGKWKDLDAVTIFDW